MSIHGKKTRVLLDGFNVSPFFREVARTGAADEVESTNFESEDREYVAGNMESGYTMTGYFDATTAMDGLTPPTTPDKYLNSIFGSEDASLIAVGRDGFAVGKRAELFIGTELGLDGPNAAIGDVVSVAATFRGQGKMSVGVVLHDPTVAENAGASGAVQDNGALSSDGGEAQLHVINNTRNGALVVKVQHSQDNITFADLATFTSVAGGAQVAQRISVAGTVERYVRALYTIGGSTGSLKFMLAFARS